MRTFRVVLEVNTIMLEPPACDTEKKDLAYLMRTGRVFAPAALRNLAAGANSRWNCGAFRVVRVEEWQKPTAATLVAGYDVKGDE